MDDRGPSIRAMPGPLSLAHAAGWMRRLLMEAALDPASG
jgi:hypothetical protein